MREGWYWPDHKCRNGHEAPRNRFDHCLQCIREYRKGKGHYQNSQGYKRWLAANKEYTSALRRDYTLRNPERRMLTAAKKTAKDRGLPFNITLDDIVVPTHCPALGIALRSQLGPRQDGTPSLDRIIPSLGYTKGNVVVISWRANRIKNDATIDELRRVAGFYSRLTTKARSNPSAEAEPQLALIET
jgi:hypothetical protein